MKTNVAGLRSNVGFLCALCAMLSALCLSSGCASMVGNYLHKGTIDERVSAVRIQADNDGARIELDLLQLRNYIGFWKDNPKSAATCLAIDVITGLSGGYAICESQKSSGSSSVTAPTINLNINSTAGRGGEGGSGGNSTVNVTIGNGNGDKK